MPENLTVIEIVDLYHGGDAIYCERIEVFYVPRIDCFYNKTGEIYLLTDTSHREWICNQIFLDCQECEVSIDRLKRNKMMDAEYFYNSFNEDKKPSRQEQNSTSDDVLNLIKVGVMSLCSVTDTEGNRATAAWEKQMPCSFADISLVADRCMHWRAAYNGHCSCHDAFAQATGADFTLPKKAEESGDESWFTEAEEVHIDAVQRWHMDGDLPLYKTASRHQGEVYYYEKWDVFFDGYGHFLHQLSIFKRKNDLNPKDAIRGFYDESENKNHWNLAIDSCINEQLIVREPIKQPDKKG
jgi:hypothetical protein